ncbi:MAG: APC family permease [Bacteroidota bacterium]|nr:APC family permease [Bacteroidota bacterium]MDP4272856.1 APC family permease [Bacteroidota bacterium]
MDSKSGSGLSKMLFFFSKLKNIFIGRARNIGDKSTFHKISLVAFFAWIGLGADGISSSCYGPEEAFHFLLGHPGLAIFVALGTVFTIFIISSSYSQIIKLFPNGGGGYLVASKLISSRVGMISGCSLLIDYLLTITLSISSGADAIFSFLPVSWHQYKITVAIIALILLILLNLRGAKESVLSLTPIFIIFLLTHVFLILYVFISKAPELPVSAHATVTDVNNCLTQFGFLGTLFIILKAYSMGAGTYTGIEAVSNGMPILREPRVKTAHKTMNLMALSLSFMVFGLLISYALYNVQINPHKTMNAILLEESTAGWHHGLSYLYILITLVSEAALLFVAAQTGFLDGPRIMANMAIDLWFPKRFAALSDRLVTQNGVVLMGLGAILLMVFTRGAVSILIVLYSINVFITFSLSQLGMVRHWWIKRDATPGWFKKLSINGIGLVLTSFILISVVVVKFREGGWITLLITGLAVMMAFQIRKHYYRVTLRLQKLRLNAYAHLEESISRLKGEGKIQEVKPVEFDPEANTAIIMVSGFGGTGLHTLLEIIESFKGIYKNFVFIRVGIINARNFKGSQEMEIFKAGVIEDGKKYTRIANSLGYYAKSLWTIGTDPVFEVERMLPKLLRVIPKPTFFGGQLVFSETFHLSRLLHNHTIFTIQKRLYKKGVTVVILPILIS